MEVKARRPTLAFARILRRGPALSLIRSVHQTATRWIRTCLSLLDGGLIQSHYLEESLENSSGRLRACTNEHGEDVDDLSINHLLSLLDLLFMSI